MDRVKSKARELFEDWWKPVTVVLLAATLLFVSARENAQTTARLEAVAFETHSALCTLHDDLANRLESTLEYLDKHPGPEPIPGITRATLRTSVRNQRATLAALSNLNC